jgi:molybdate transport system substrate-binding protein
MDVRRRSFVTGLALTTTAGWLLSTKVSRDAAAVGPVEVKMLTSVAVISALNELAPQFERMSGDKLSIGYSLIADIRKRVLNGETADVIMLSRPVMEELQAKDKIVPGSVARVRASSH